MSSLLKLMAPFEVFFVAVHCPLEELELSGTEPPEVNAQRLIRAWNDRTRPSAFERMASWQ
jgi:hypothetical protein